MKKLMTLLAAVAVAGIAQAASIEWATSNTGLFNPDGSEAGGEGYITMYLFSIDSATYGTLTAGGEAGVSSAVWGAYGKNLASATGFYADDGMGQITIADPGSYGVGNTAYAAVILTYDDGSGVSHYIANAGAYTFDADMSKVVYEMDAFVGGDAGSMSTAVSWQSVPEPTSGLLFLLGMAGLALKRKRA